MMTTEAMPKTIYQSLVAAQKAFGPALKNSTNPHLRSKYADLGACIDAVLEALNNNGLAFVQKTHDVPQGVAVETVFVHESGETFSAGIIRLPVSKNDAQGYGSALTYARRYSLMAACGIAPEDDDGNAAGKGSKKKGDGKPDEEDTPEWMKNKRDPVRALRDAIDGEDWLVVGAHVIETKCSLKGLTVKEAVERFRPTVIQNIKRFKSEADREACLAYLGSMGATESADEDPPFSFGEEGKDEG